MWFVEPSPQLQRMANSSVGESLYSTRSFIALAPTITFTAPLEIVRRQEEAMRCNRPPQNEGNLTRRVIERMFHIVPLHIEDPQIPQSPSIVSMHVTCNGLRC
jgi:hypothetical protein